MKEINEIEGDCLKEVNRYIVEHNRKAGYGIKGFIFIRTGEQRKRFTIWFNDVHEVEKADGKIFRYPCRYNKEHLGYCNYENMLETLSNLININVEQNSALWKIKLEVGTLRDWNAYGDRLKNKELGFGSNFLNTVMPFGKYKGTPIGKVKEIDLRYFCWVEDCCSMTSMAYLIHTYSHEMKEFFYKLAYDFQVYKKKTDPKYIKYNDPYNEEKIRKEVEVIAARKTTI
jgi:hypothetical protein